MATNYPGSLDSGTQQPSPSSSTEMDDSGFEHDVVHTNHSGAIIALETKVGTGDSNAVANSVLAGTGSGTSGWSTAPSLAGLTVDTDTLHVDATNNRVGIGTTSPETPLNIVTINKLGSTFTGATDGEGLRVDQSNYVAGNYVSLIEGSYNDAQTAAHVRIGAMYDGGGSHLAFGTSNNFGNGITNTALFIDQTGNVGIGTTSPLQELDIAADSPVLRLTDTDTALSDNELSSAIEFYSSDTSAQGVAAYIHADGDGSVGNLQLRLGTGTPGGASDRMTIDAIGRVGIGTTSPVDLLQVGDASTSGSFRVHASGGGESFRVTTTVVRSANINNLTTGSAANVYIATSNNSMYRSTSSIKYKTDVETMQDSYADAILGLRPVWYRSLGAHDPLSYGYWGFIAEEVAEVDPRLVSFGVPTDYERQYDEDGEPIDPDVADLTEPEGVQYDRLVPHLVNLLARQRDQIVDLSSRVAELEAA